MYSECGWWWYDWRDIVYVAKPSPRGESVCVWLDTEYSKTGRKQKFPGIDLSNDENPVSGL